MISKRMLELAGIKTDDPGETVILNENDRLMELAGVDKKKTGTVVKLEKDTEDNNYFRKVIFTTKLSQLVLMSLKPGEDIGSEVHETGDQFIRIDKGEAKSVLAGKETPMSDGDAVVIPEGVEHNIINTSETEDLKIYAVYSPPQHKDGTVDRTKPKKD